MDILSAVPWVYENLSPQEDEYTVYRASFLSSEEDLTLLVCGDSDLAFYLNGELVYFSLSPSYPSSPIADLVKIKAKKGRNEIRIVLYYCGATSFSSYAKGQAGFKFAFLDSTLNLLCHSSSSLLCSLDPNYVSHRKKIITVQMGYSYSYEAKTRECRLHAAFEVPFEGKPIPRVNKRCLLLGRAKGDIKHLGKGHYLVSFGIETVGYLDLSFVSNKEQRIVFAYGEHLESAHVPYLIHGRDFSLDYCAKLGRNEFLGTFRRVASRHIEVFAEDDLDIAYIGLRETAYPFEIIPHKLDNPLLEQIYETSLRTLLCCYHEHYEDCPWREQCLYAMDSYNQALAGLVCFENKEQIKASLNLISLDQRKDHLLSICSPSQNELTIPSFSLFFVRACALYLDASGDVSFLKRIYPKIKDIMNAFFAKEENGLLYTFTHTGAWNFYEWAPGLDGSLGEKQKKKADLILNGLFVLALNDLERIENKLGIESDYSSFKKHNKERAREVFFTCELFKNSDEDESISEYGNALAVLVGYAERQEAMGIAEAIKNNDGALTRSTLASRPFVYDALFNVDKDNASFILEDIKITFGRMLSQGASTFFETEKGAADFDGAGSLCHGWSAYPIVYFKKFGLLK